MPATITVPVDTEIADLYAQASPEIRRKVQLLLSLRAREIILSSQPLPELMDEISRRAQERGLTPEILESLLDEH